MSRNDQYIAEQSPVANRIPVTEDEEPFFVEIDEPSPSPSPPTADENAPPQWFRRPASPQNATPAQPPASPRRNDLTASPKQRKKPLRRARTPLIKTDDEDPEELTWQERFNRWFQDGGGAGFGVSVAVHAVLLLMLSLWILHQPEDVELVTTMEQSEPFDAGPIKEVDLNVDLKPDIPQQINNPQFEAAPVSTADLGIGSLAFSINTPKAGGLDLKIPSQAVTKGSFTVWTEPEDPVPGEKYMIMIQIKLNNDVKMYPLSDLKGKVVGTDNYTDHFGGPTESAKIPVKNRTVVIKACPVPGAQELVKDVITVESKMLNEKQTIELVF